MTDQEKVDLIFTQYCKGIFSMILWVPKEKREKVFNNNMLGKTEQLKAVFGIVPSIKFTIVVTANSFEMIETSLN